MDSEEKALLHIFVARLFRFYFIMEKTILDKPFLTFEEQINKLINEKHLVINNRDYALEALSSISYYETSLMVIKICTKRMMYLYQD